MDENRTIGTSEETLVEPGPNRVAIVITNYHATATIRVTKENGKSAQGTPIFAESGVSILMVDGWDTETKWYVVSDAANTTINIHQEFNPMLRHRLKGGGSGNLMQRSPFMGLLNR